MNHKPENKDQVIGIIQGLLEIYKQKIGEIDPDKYLTVEFTYVDAKVFVKFVYVYKDVASEHDDPQRDNSYHKIDWKALSWKVTDPLKDLVVQVWAILEEIDEVKIDTERDTDNG